jgi:chemotaxis signal transduction protein
MSGYLIFDLGGRELAAPLAEVREVVRIDRLESLPGLEPPVTGLMQLRGSPLPVCDLRLPTASAAVGTDGSGGGDIVLLALPEVGLLGVAVDRVIAVVAHEALVAVEGGAVPIGMPSYLVGLLRHADRADDAVFLVAMDKLVASLFDRRVPAAR